MIFATALLVLLQDVENDPRFHDLLKAAAKDHEAYGRVDDALRFAPALCMAPPPSPVRFSASKDEGTHGGKLYFLYAWDAGTYLKEARPDVYPRRQKPPAYEGKPALQVLIKQSWTAVPAEKEAGERQRFARKDGKLFTTGEKKDFFVMVKLGDATEGTDRGWVYGTVAPDGQSVTSAGRVKSCMACHEKTGDGRLFGLPKDAGR